MHSFNFKFTDASMSGGVHLGCRWGCVFWRPQKCQGLLGRALPQQADQPRLTCLCMCILQQLQPQLLCGFIQVQLLQKVKHLHKRPHFDASRPKGSSSCARAYVSSPPNAICSCGSAGHPTTDSMSRLQHWFCGPVYFTMLC